MAAPAPLPVIKTSQGPQVGPYIFGKTLGSGSTGKVKLVCLKHFVIVNRSESPKFVSCCPPNETRHFIRSSHCRRLNDHVY